MTAENGPRAALAVREDHTPDRRSDPVALGQVLAGSGYFADARQAAQAAVKVMAGQELGLGPIASMTGIHIVQGKVTIGANLIAAMIRRSGRYTYRITQHTDEVCELVFFEAGQEIGRSAFSIEDARRAGLVKAGSPWVSHPKNMLFARAISNGAKWHCPDVFTGPIYTPDEFGVDVDPQTGEVLRPETLAPTGPSAGPTEPTAHTPRAPDEKPASKAQQGYITGILKRLAELKPDTAWEAELTQTVGRPVAEFTAAQASHVIESLKTTVAKAEAEQPKSKAKPRRKDVDDELDADPGSPAPPPGQETLA
jgi:hypothetical protein